jgi:hypothetical protein
MENGRSRVTAFADRGNESRGQDVRLDASADKPGGLRAQTALIAFRPNDSPSGFVILAAVLVAAAIGGMALPSCGTFSDLDSVKPGGDAAADTDTDTDTDTDVDTDTDSDTDFDCNDVDTEPCGVDSGQYCDEASGDCVPCVVDEHCGMACDACPEDAAMPVCDGDTPETAQCVCETAPAPNGSCDTGARCVAGACTACDVDEYCGDDCSPCPTTAPHCFAETVGEAGTCVECVDDAGCRSGEEPFDSSLGVCTPDHTCTCWVDPADSDPPTWECLTGTDCATGYSCAEDFTSHYVCLHNCTTAAGPANGLACILKDTLPSHTDALVWSPMTTCFAFYSFGADCTSDVGICSVDGTGGIADAFCPDGVCTYPCTTDDWCIEADPGCGTSAPYSGLCEP